MSYGLPATTRVRDGSERGRNVQLKRQDHRLFQALRARLRSVLSLRDALADISQQHLAKACCEMSRRDCAIVAWREVPGTAPPPKEPSRRVRGDSCRCARLDVAKAVQSTKEGSSAWIHHLQQFPPYIVLVLIIGFRSPLVHRRLHLRKGKSAKTQPMKSRTRTTTIGEAEEVRGNPGLPYRLLFRIGKELGVFLFELVKEPLSDCVER
jgi:hypothetical protein